MSKLKNTKLLPILLAISAVVVLAGIILMAVLGFNRSAEYPNNYTVEVGYNVIVKNSDEKLETLEKIVDEAFKDAGLTVKKAEKGIGEDTSLDWSVIRYTFSKGATQEKLNTAKSSIEAKLKTAFAADEHVETQVDVHKNENLSTSYTVIWRSSLAIGVGVIVGLIYVGIRFGVGSALTGLTLAAHDALFTVCLFAIFRIPVYSAAPVLYAAIAAIVSVVLWLITCMKLREQKKDPAFKGVTAEESVAAAQKGARKAIVSVAAAFGAVIVLIGAIATAGARALALPAILAIAAAAYSSLLFGPALHVPVKKAFDAFAAKHKPRYTGKKKAEETEN